jgi:hypothetical protein
LLILIPACHKHGKSRIIYPSTPPPETVTAGPSIRTQTWDFDRLPAGKQPEGWRVAETKPAGELATWAVVAEPTAPSQPNALAITQTQNAGSTFNLAIAEGTSYKDLDLSVKIKPITGKEDQGGGLIWRCKDANNYYVCRWNPLETNFRLYSVIAGKRSKPIVSVDTDARPDAWHTIRITMTGNQIACYLDGLKLLEAQDDSLPDAGMIGLWTKADAASAFDDVTVREIPAGVRS